MSALLLGEVRPPVFLLLYFMLGAAAQAQQDAPGLPGLQPIASRYEGRGIARVEFDPPEQPMGREELDALLPFHAGSVLHLGDLRIALQKLYETGRFADVSIDGTPSQDGAGVVLRIATTPRFFIGEVKVEGAANPPSESQLLTASKLELGTPFAGPEINQAVGNMQERLRANGFYNATIQYHLERNTATEEANIRFELDSGDRARFAGARFTGNFDVSNQQLIRATGWRRGFLFLTLPGWRDVTEERVQGGINRVRQRFQKQNRLLVRVTLDRLDYEQKTNTVTPTLLIDSGPVINVTTTGAKVSQGRLRDLIPIFQEHTVDRSLLLEGARNLTNYFQSQGYFDAAVDFKDETEDPESQTITYLVTPNVRHKLVSIEIKGNHFFSEDTIRERLSLREAGSIRQRYGRYSQRLRDQDRDAIRDLYRSNGFRDVVVTASTIDDYQGKQDQLGVRFEIQEGAQWLVGSLSIEGASDADAAYLRGILQSAPGQAFSEASVAADQDTILSFYLNNGYPNVTAEWSQTPAEAQNQVDLRYTIHPGERRFVRDVLIRGLATTNLSLVSSRIMVHPGEPISQGQIAASQQKLYDLGIFSKVQTALQNPDGVEDKKYVLFQVDEANKYSFNVGFGAEIARIGGVTNFDAPAGQAGFSPRASIGISRLNLLGLAHTASVQTQVSTLLSRAIGSYLIPQFTGKEDLSLLYSMLFEDSHDINTYSSRRWENSLQLTQRLSRANTLQYRFAFRRVITSDVNIAQGLIPQSSQPVRVGLYSTSFIQDRRDNPTDSHRGYMNTIDVGLSIPAFGSETDYTRVVLRNSTYHPIGRDLVIARSFQFGYLQRIGGLNPVPLSEVFFSGGASTHRAFPENQAGPRDPVTGFPTGGNAMLFHSTELRFPLFGDHMGGVLFHDMGNVYTSINDISFRFRQRDLTDFDYMVHAIGFGIRYRTPVGPLRLDLSLSPNSPRFLGFSGTRDEWIANHCVAVAPNCPQSEQRISVFQFHFSLGQTF